MSESTTTLAALRRALCVEMKMPFFRRNPSGYAEMDSGSSTGKVVDSSLSQRDGFWNGSWFYNVGTGEVSLVRSFQANDNTLFLETPMASSPSVGDDYELHEMWNAIDLKHFINQAILEGGRTWSETITDETMVLQEDKLKYDLTALSRRPWILAKVLVENRGSVVRGMIVSSTNNTFTVDSASAFGGVVTASDWRVSIYKGTGTGQIRTLSSVAGSTGTISANWTTNPDTTSKFALWNSNEDRSPWIPLDSYRIDAKENPDTLELYRRMESYFGMRIRLEYISEPIKLTTEDSTTTVPERWIIPYAAHLMLGQRTTDTKTDREMFREKSEWYRLMAEEYRTRNAPHKPDVSLKTPQPGNTYIPNGDPLGWRR